MKTITFAAVFALVAFSAAPSFAEDNQYAAQLTEFANGQLKQIAADASLIAAITAQNGESAGYDQAKIDELDTQWRAEVDAAAKPLIDKVLGTDASKALLAAQEASGGLITEIFATDAKGLNVAQSTVTSDYWQGDEDKFTQTYPIGASAVFLGEVEQDESTQTYQSQVSITVVDAAGNPIGSLTAGIDLSQL